MTAASRSPLPVRDGVGATRLRIPRTGPWATVADYMSERFAHIGGARIRERIVQGDVVGADGRPITLATPLGAGDFVWYYRDPPREREIPFEIDVVHADDDLVVIDKPHFLPTTPSGGFLQHTALVRLRRLFGNDDLTPIHRLDRHTAGLVMFSARPQSRGAYQTMFERRDVHKVYEAVSARPDDFDAEHPALAELSFPITVRSHIRKQRGVLTVQTIADAPPNAETRIELIQADDRVLHTRLLPHTGQMHQLRVHLAMLGTGILNDPLYPVLHDEAPDDFDQPLQLLARELRFDDPLAGRERHFTTRRSLDAAP